MSESRVFSLNEKIKKLNFICVSIAGCILLFIAFSIFVDVFLRYFFHRPSIWITEVSTYLFLYLIFLSTSYALQQDMHIKVTFLLFAFSDRVKRIFHLITAIFAMIFCSVLFWQTTAMTWSAYNERWTSPTMLSAPVAYIYIIMVIGSFLLFFTFLLQTIIQFKQLENPKNDGKGR